MKERPILFSGPMVRAIRAGKKTQTRRVLKLPEGYTQSSRIKIVSSRPKCGEAFGTTTGWRASAGQFDVWSDVFSCPYGVPGDRLWVRESVSFSTSRLTLVKIPKAEQKRLYPDIRVWYQADNHRPTWAETKWVPSIHMPRWASRITLEITDIRVERLNDISEEDAIAEGCESTAVLTAGGHDYTGLYAKEHYAELWEQINGVGSWQTNPLVWVVSFTEVK